MSDQVSKYFDRHAASWVKHYRQPDLALRLFDAVFRRGLRRRWDIMMKYALPARRKTFLDIGCGTGDYCFALIQDGAEAVTGVDFAPGMVELSRRAATELEVEDRCQFVLGDFADVEFAQRFDVVFAMGVFDYVEDYTPFWLKMVSLTRGIVIASFPTYVIPRAPIRRLRYRWKRLPVYFYSREQLDELGRAPGLKYFVIEPYPAGLALIGFIQ